MKTERITLLGSPEFKKFLVQKAKKEGLSISEFVRRCCEHTPTEEEQNLTLLANELSRAVKEAKSTLHHGIEAIQQVLSDIDSNRSRRREAK